jgi:hypothetical protein
VRKASTWTLEQGTQRRPLLQTSSPLKPKIDRGLTLRLVQQTGARHQNDLKNRFRERSSSEFHAAAANTF